MPDVVSSLFQGIGLGKGGLLDLTVRISWSDVTGLSICFGYE